VPGVSTSFAGSCMHREAIQVVEGNITEQEATEFLEGVLAEIHGGMEEAAEPETLDDMEQVASVS